MSSPEPASEPTASEPTASEPTTPDGAAGPPPAAEPGPGDRAGGAGAGSPHLEAHRVGPIPPDPGWPLTADYVGLITARSAAPFEEKRLG